MIKKMLTRANKNKKLEKYLFETNTRTLNLPLSWEMHYPTKIFPKLKNILLFH